MSARFIPPAHGVEAFHCPRCNVFAQQHWLPALVQQGTFMSPVDYVDFSICAHCAKPSIWVQTQLVYPEDASGAPFPHADMPPDVAVDFVEARAIVNRSPRGASALLRLALQKLCKDLGEPGKNLNDDIASLVKKGLLPQVQHSLDALRVIGNEAVHPGLLDLRDDQAMAMALFNAMNLIVEQLITAPKQAAALFAQVPESKRDAIDERDRPADEGS